ncbi:MAG: AAA family ATPase, partial [Lawsonibacter sp.]|nr:AAA family ATPase [Lawsonibacter sp.]
MKIKSMTATFGRLERARLEPGPGLNLLHAPNEGGKSTWAAFWRAMLYGI